MKAMQVWWHSFYPGVRESPKLRTCQTDALVTTVLLIEAHTSASVDGCKAFTTRVLPEAAKQLALKFYADLTD